MAEDKVTRFTMTNVTMFYIYKIFQKFEIKVIFLFFNVYDNVRTYTYI